jgi:hypothetical protein
MDMSYAFTEDDLWAYLETKRDDEIVGYCGDTGTCLIAQAVRAKYAGQVGDGDVRVGVSASGSRMEIDLEHIGVCLPLTPMLERVMQVFDDRTGKTIDDPVTKEEFMRAWQAFLAGQDGGC